MGNTEVEMRSFERVKLCCPADLMLSGANGPEHVFVTDLSESGAFAQTRLKLRRGEKMLMRLRLDDDKVATLPCEVSWARPFDPISVDGNMAGLGLRFRDADLNDQALVRDHVQHLLKKPEKVQAQAAQAAVQAAAQCAVQPKEQITEPGKFKVASANLSSSHDMSAWQDTLVDEPSMSMPPEGSLSLGCEPALGDLDLSQFSHHGTSIFPRSPKSWTPWLAAGSLLMGIAAGGVYALMAPAPVPSTELVEQVNPMQQANPAVQTKKQSAHELEKNTVKSNTYNKNAAHGKVQVVARQASKTTTQKASAKTTASAKSTSIKKASSPKATAQSAVASAKVAAKSSAKSSAKSPDGQALSGTLNGPINTGRGWFVTVKGGARALHNFTLDGPPRAVIDLSTAAGDGLHSQQIARGPFKSLRVGKGSDKIRLVFDLSAKVNTRNVRFTTKGKDLLIEIPRDAMALR